MMGGRPAATSGLQAAFLPADVKGCRRFHRACLAFARLLRSALYRQSQPQAVLGDLLVAKLQQIAERRATVPILGNVQFAGRLAQLRHNQSPISTRYRS